jgi:hypothetical protein
MTAAYIHLNGFHHRVENRPTPDSSSYRVPSIGST